MTTTTDSDSTWRRASQALRAHVRALVATIETMKATRDQLPTEFIGERILAEIRIQNAERELQTVRERLRGGP